MTDRELLEYSARAADISGSDYKTLTGRIWDYELQIWKRAWNPLESDGDTFRLAVKLNIFNTRSKCYEWPVEALFTEHGDDPYAATRRAVVRAAAEIGKAM